MKSSRASISTPFLAASAVIASRARLSLLLFLMAMLVKFVISGVASLMAV
jgi:hypothetical protein